MHNRFSRQGESVLSSFFLLGMLSMMAWASVSTTSRPTARSCINDCGWPLFVASLGPWTSFVWSGSFNTFFGCRPNNLVTRLGHRFMQRALGQIRLSNRDRRYFGSWNHFCFWYFNGYLNGRHHRLNNWCRFAFGIFFFGLDFGCLT